MLLGVSKVYRKIGQALGNTKGVLVIDRQREILKEGIKDLKIGKVPVHVVEEVTTKTSKLYAEAAFGLFHSSEPNYKALMDISEKLKNLH